MYAFIALSITGVMAKENPNPESGSLAASLLCSRLDFGPLPLSDSPLARIKHAILLNYPCKQAPGRAGNERGEKSLQPLENKNFLSFSTILQIKMRGREGAPFLPEYNEWRAQAWWRRKFNA